MQQPAGAIVIRQGAGYRHAGGSAKVREVQRRLVALGYRPGSIDGAFGPRTRSSVAWFQIKHRLAPTGAVDSQTLNLLRYRTHGWPRVAAPTAAPAAAPAKTPAPTPDAAPSAPTPTPDAAPPARTGAPRPDAAPAPAPRAKHQPARAPRPDAAPAAAVAPAAHHGGSRNFIVWILAVLALQLVILALIRNWPLIRPHLPDRERLVACRTRLSERMARLRGRLQRPRDHFSGLVKRIPSPVELRERISPLARIRVPKPDLAKLRVRKPVRLAARLVPAHRPFNRSQPQRGPARAAATRRGRPSGAVAVPTRTPAANKATPIAATAAVPAAATGPRRAIGYAVARNDNEFAPQQRAMERICGERGWTLAALVKEPDDRHSEPRGRAGLTHVLRQVGSGTVAQLIVGRVHSLARSPKELASVLDWCGRHDVGVVALDVGLDTTTADGRLAARCLGAVAALPAGGQRALRNRDTHANGNGHANGNTHANGNGTPSQAVKTFGYASVEHDTKDATADLEAQRRLIERKCRQCGLDLVEFGGEREPKDGKALERPSLSYLLGRIAIGDAACLVVTGLDRLSRSIVELSSLLRWFEQNGVRLVVVELELDTATPEGLTTARSLASIGGWERERLSERTRRGLAAAQAKRSTARGSREPDRAALRKRIADMRASGMTLQAIADVLNYESVPTERGGAKWRPSSVQTATGYKRRARTVVDDLPTATADGRNGTATSGGG